MKSQDGPLSPAAQQLLDLLPPDTSSMGNVTLRRALDLSESEYRQAVEELDALGLVHHGRGGTVICKVPEGSRADRARGPADEPVGGLPPRC